MKIFNDQQLIRIKKQQELIKLHPYPRSFGTLTLLADIKQNYSFFTNESLPFDIFHFYGRVIIKRQTFIVIQEEDTKLQLYIPKKDQNNNVTKLFEYYEQYLDIGDLIYGSGTLFFTKLSELTIKVIQLIIATKSLYPLPEKYHGIKDEEIKRRQPYLECIINTQVITDYIKRQKLINSIREYLINHSYIEMETPILHQFLSGANAQPFITHYNSLNQDFYLRIAPEIYLKKLLIAGFNKIFEIGRVFRNEGIDSTHNPEFTMIEFYTAHANLSDIITLTTNIIKNIANKLKIFQLNVDEKIIDFTKEFKCKSIQELVKEKTTIDFLDPKLTFEDAWIIAQKYNIFLLPFQKNNGHLMHKLFEELCEKDLINPTFVTGHHLNVSPLSLSDPNNKEIALRFELYINGVEIANGFEELTNSFIQEKRFQQQLAEKDTGNVESQEIDYEFITALEYGMPPTGGVGIGIDRLVMLFNQKKNIKDVIFFPHNRKK